jgi:hypothetical protein
MILEKYRLLTDDQLHAEQIRLSGEADDLAAERYAIAMILNERHAEKKIAKAVVDLSPEHIERIQKMTPEQIQQLKGA